MKISVIIPSYRPQEYLWECLDSLYSQTLPKEDFEVMLVLNGEKEPYYSRIEEYISAHDPEMNIRLVHTEVKGVSHARNIGLDMSNGSYVSFIDDDDMVSSSFLEDLYAKADPKTLVLAYPSAFMDDGTEKYGYRTEEEFKRLSSAGRTKYLDVRSLLHVAAMKLIPMDIIGKRRFDESMSYGEDTMFMFHISDRFTSVDFAPETAVYHRRFRNGGAVNSFAGSRFVNKLTICLKSIWKYSRIYFSSICRYSFLFYLTRIWGALHNLTRK